MQPQQRDYAKQLAYGLLYFKGAHALAVDLSCDVKQAARHHESFMQSIPDVVSHTGPAVVPYADLVDCGEVSVVICGHLGYCGEVTVVTCGI